MKRKSILLLIAIVLLAATLAGCSSSPKGTFIAVDGYAPFGYPDEIEFIDDELCAVDGFPGMYQIKKGRLTLIVMGQAYSYAYTMDDINTILLDDGGGEVKYRKDTGMSSAANEGQPFTIEVEGNGSEQRYTLSVSEEAPAPTPEPTLSPEEVTQNAYEQAVGDLRTKLAEYDAAGDVQGAMQYLTEQVKQLEITYPNVTPDPELEAFQQSYAVAYKTDVLSRANAAFEQSGYQSALDVLYASVQYLDPEDPDILQSIEHYKEYGPVSFYDLKYFTYEGREFKKVGQELDNLENVHTNVVMLRDYKKIGSETYVLSGVHKTFSGVIFMPFDRRDGEDIYIVNIYGNDQLLYTSPEITRGVFPIDFSVPIEGVSMLKVEIQVVYDFPGDSGSESFPVYLDGTLNP